MNLGVLLFHEVNELDVATPYSLINTAKTYLQPDQKLELFTVAKSRNSVQTQADMTITPTWAFASAPACDVLIVPGGRGVSSAMKDKALKQYLAQQQPGILASISSGALLLGVTGHLRGQTVTTHPDVTEQLEDYEVASVSADALVKTDSGIWSCRSSADSSLLALALLRQLFGEDVARNVAMHAGFTEL